MKRLSPRQKEVLILVAEGMKYKEIAAKLGVTERTIKYYMEEILQKLHMENRSQAVKYVIQEGIIN
jgi:two-component system NarL family response regulator